MGAATIVRNDVLFPSIDFFDTVTAGATVSVSGCSGPNSMTGHVELWIHAKYYNGAAYMTGKDKTLKLADQNKIGNGSISLSAQRSNYDAGTWVRGNRPTGATKALYYYTSKVSGYSACPASWNDSDDGAESDWVTW